MKKANPYAGNGQPPDDDLPPAPARRISSAVVGGALLGILIAGVAVLFYSVISGRETIPPLTEAVYEAALEKWKTHGPTNYNLDLVISGNQSGEIHVEVRDGQVTKMTRNGIVPERRATWDYWSVDSQFETIGEEMEMARNPKKGFPAPAGSRVVQRAEFDPTLGYPREYQRMVLGARLEIHWKVTQFDELQATNERERSRK